jgi:histidinol phosphatase-like enzyme (inositol monophosphatase family)
MDLAPYRTFIAELAAESGAFIRPFFGRRDLAVELKGDASPVTLADRGAEELLRRRIAARFPQHGIIGEELGNVREDAEWVWVLDPIDGTKAFITAVPLWGTLIALLHRGQPVLGCIHQPILGQLLLGDGHTTTLNGQTVRCRSTTRVEEATVLTSDHLNLARYQDGPDCDRLLARARLVRTWGDCYGYLLLATGYADVCLDPIMNPWDIAALVPIVRGAGGTISDWRGAAAYPAEHTIAAATPELHAEVVAALRA